MCLNLRFRNRKSKDGFFDPPSPRLWRGKQKDERKKRMNGAGFAEALRREGLANRVSPV
jgi:hypothetical protein